MDFEWKRKHNTWTKSIKVSVGKNGCRLYTVYIENNEAFIEKRWISSKPPWERKTNTFQTFTESQEETFETMRIICATLLPLPFSNCSKDVSFWEFIHSCSCQTWKCIIEMASFYILPDLELLEWSSKAPIQGPLLSVQIQLWWRRLQRLQWTQGIRSAQDESSCCPPLSAFALSPQVWRQDQSMCSICATNI